MKASTKGMNGYGNGQSHAANSRYGPDSRVQYMEQGRVRRDFETGRGKGESYSLDSSDQEGIRVERGFIVHNPRNDMV